MEKRTKVENCFPDKYIDRIYEKELCHVIQQQNVEHKAIIVSS